MFAAMVCRSNWLRYIILIIVQVLAVTAIFSLSPNIQDRFNNKVMNSLPTGLRSDYFRVMGADIMVFKTSPVIGIGSATHRELCTVIVGEVPEFRCDNYPHNFYIQLITETGFVGLIAGSLMIVSIILTTFSDWKKTVMMLLRPLHLLFH